MEFSKKLQELRKSRNLTQEQLAEALYVSRTAVSKWESGRGYPSIDSLRAIAEFFSTTVDELLSCEEVITIAEEDSKNKESAVRDTVFACLDECVTILLFLPFFAEKADGIIRSVSLLNLHNAASYMTVLYYAFVLCTAIYGIMTFALQNCTKAFWVKYKSRISLILTMTGTMLFILSLQPYAATFAFVLTIIKVLLLVKKP